MKGSGVDGAITRSDVINIFTVIYPGNEWVLTRNNGKDGWFSNKDFDKMLTEFNTRNDFLITKGIDQFIANYYDTAYERFYLNLPHGAISHLDIVNNADGFYSLVFPQPTFTEFNILMNLDSGLFYPEY